MLLSNLPKIDRVSWDRVSWARFLVSYVAGSGKVQYFQATFFGILDHFVYSTHIVSTEIESNENF